MIRFVTDGSMVFEVLGVQIQRNYGLMATAVRAYVLLPLSNDPDYTEPITVNEATFNKLTPVEPTIEHAVADLRRDLDRWATERPAWLD